MPTLAERQLTPDKFAAMCDELRGLAETPLIEEVREVLVRYGVTSPTSKDGKPSLMAARALRDGPFKRYVERLNAGRETREALCAAAGAGVHPLDAIEEAMVIELQDHLAEAETLDVKWVVSQLVKLRTSITMREDTRRKQADLERKQRETTAKLELAEARERLYAEQIARFEREKADWEKKRSDALAALAVAEKKGGVTADTRKLIEDAMAGRLSA